MKERQRKATKGMPGAERLNDTCFGTTPGGGLDAFAFKVPDGDEYGIGFHCENSD